MSKSSGNCRDCRLVRDRAKDLAVAGGRSGETAWAGVPGRQDSPDADDAGPRPGPGRFFLHARFAVASGRSIAKAIDSARRDVEARSQRSTDHRARPGRPGHDRDVHPHAASASYRSELACTSSTTRVGGSTPCGPAIAVMPPSPSAGASSCLTLDKSGVRPRRSCCQPEASSDLPGRA